MVEGFDGNISPHQIAKWGSESGQEAKTMMGSKIIDQDTGKDKLRYVNIFT